MNNVRPFTDGTPQLELQDIVFGYGAQPVLYQVSTRIYAGEMLALLGPNGSGKTTLLRLLSGVLTPQSGTVKLEGRELQKWGRRAIAQRIAVVPQEAHIPFAFTVEQIVEMGRTPFTRSFWSSQSIYDRGHVRDAMQASGVTGLATRIFNELSGGEQQRVLLALALAQEPAILLLDEPTSHLDIKYQVELLELAQRLNQERGVTVIAAIHDLNLAARYFSRLQLFQRGIIADGGPAEVLEPGLLSRVYDVNVQVGILRGAEHLSILPPATPAVREPEARAPYSRIHIIAGGGSGELAMRALADARLAFSAGALNIGDSDYVLALRLAEEVVVEQPFTPISGQALERVRELLEQALVLILCPTVIGPGNLPLLQVAVEAAQSGLKVLMLDDGVAPDALQVAARDYTSGEGTRLLEALLQADTLVVHTISELVDQAQKSIERSLLEQSDHA